MASLLLGFASSLLGKLMELFTHEFFTFLEQPKEVAAAPLPTFLSTVDVTSDVDDIIARMSRKRN